MKLITFTEASRTRIGLLQDHHVVDLSQAAPSLPQNMLSLLQPAMQQCRRRLNTPALPPIIRYPML